MSYARFLVTGPAPRRVDDDVLQAFSDGVLTPTTIGAPPEVEAGWTTGEHIYDTDFQPQKLLFGSDVLVGMRLDTNKAPADVKRAYRAMAEGQRRAASPTGFLNRAERLAAKEEAERLLHEELAQGAHRKSKLVPVLWDLERGMVYAPAFADAPMTALRDLFRNTFDCVIEPATAGVLARERFAGQGRTRDYEDLRPAAFVAAPPDADAESRTGPPPIPWTYGGPEPSDFLGNEFLLWLWWKATTDEGLIDGAGGRQVAFVFEKSLDTDCAWGATGSQSLKADGPTRRPEAMMALQQGKLPRKAGLTLAADGEQWSFTIQADRFNVSSLRIPKPEDPPAPGRETIEYRLASQRSFEQTWMSLYEMFLDRRVSEGWTQDREAMTRWIRSGGRSTVAPSAVVEVKAEAPVEV